MMMHRSWRLRKMRSRDFTRPSTIVFRGTHLLRAVFKTHTTHVHKTFYIFNIYIVLYVILYKLQVPRDNKRIGGCSVKGVWWREGDTDYEPIVFGTQKIYYLKWVASCTYIYILYTVEVLWIYEWNRVFLVV